MTINLAELKVLETKATPGPWEYGNGEYSTGVRNGIRYVMRLRQDVGPTSGDAALLVAARNALPDLLALLEEAQRLVSLLRCDMECVPDDAADYAGHWPDCVTVQARAFLAHFATANGGKE